MLWPVFLVRDDSNGEISINDQGQPRVDYSLKAKELESIAKGIEIICKMWFKLGASRLVTSHMAKPVLKSPDEIPSSSMPSRKIPGASSWLRPSARGSSHGRQSGSLRGGYNGKSNGFKNLFVCDASVFLLPSGLILN